MPQAAVDPADAADVEHRQRGETDGVGVERPARGRRGRRGEVPVRGQHALGDARRAGGVHLHDDVAGLPATAGVDGVVAEQPVLVVVPDDAQRPRREALGDPPVDGVGDQQRCLRVREHAAELARRQPPVERHDDGAYLGDGEQQLDDLGRRPAEVGDA